MTGTSSGSDPVRRTRVVSPASGGVQRTRVPVATKPPAKRTREAVGPKVPVSSVLAEIRAKYRPDLAAVPRSAPTSIQSPEPAASRPAAPAAARKAWSPKLVLPRFRPVRVPSIGVLVPPLVAAIIVGGALGLGLRPAAQTAVAERKVQVITSQYDEEKRACRMRGREYMRSLNSYPKLDDGRDAETVIAERCDATIVAF